MILRALTTASRAQGLAGRRVLVAVSGGVDSVVLLHALRACGGRLGLAALAGHVNHGLRGAESDADEACVRALAGRLDVPLGVERLDPAALSRDGPSRARPTLQEAARRARYDALDRIAAGLGAERIVTAHTADDQAETVLLRLLRGSGADGLGGIPECSPDGRIARPLLGVTRAEIASYARAHGLRWREDPSNRSQAFARARLRTRWLPGLARAFNPRLLRAVADLAEAHRRDAEWIEELVDEEAGRRFDAAPGALHIVREGWDRVPEALARRLARRALREMGAGRDVSRRHLRRMLDFWRNGRVGARLELPGGLVMRAEREGFWLRPAGVQAEGACYDPRTSPTARPRGADGRATAAAQGLSGARRRETT